MSAVQFILGRAGTGKTYWCVQQAARALQDRSERPLVLLVPEQATYQMEKAVLSREGIQGFSRLKILSFQRLGFWLKRHRPLKSAVEPAAKTLVVQRCLMEIKDRLTLLKPSESQLGLAGRLMKVFEQLYDADISPQALRQAAEAIAQKNASDPAALKWRDIAAAFEAYDQYYQDPAAPLNPNRQLADVKSALRQADFLNDALIWVDGFSGFTAQEKLALLEMIRRARCAHIALCLDPTRIDLTNADPALIDPSSPFYPTEQTYADLLARCGQCRFDIQPPILLTETRRFAHPALRALEANLLNEKAAPTRCDNAVRLVVCANPQQEVEQAALEILKKVKTEQYRWRQIAVAAPDLTLYAPHIESVFRRLDIPYFIDTPISIRQHPLTEALAAALTAAQTYDTAEWICLAKTGLLRIAPSHIEQLEQYALRYGVLPQDWKSAAAWSFSADSRENQRAQRLRQKILAAVEPLRQRLFDIGQPIPAIAFVQAVWEFLRRIDAAKTLNRWLTEEPSDPFGHRQVFEQLVGLLDGLVWIFGDRRQPASVWGDLFIQSAGCVSFKRIPPALDQVLVGALERSRHPELRTLILLGGCQKWFPAPLSIADMVSKADRLAVARQGLDLPDPLTDQLDHRTYLAYIAFTRASEQIILTIPKLDQKETPLTISPWAERLMALFSDLTAAPAEQQTNLWDCLHPTQLARRLAECAGRDSSEPTDAQAAGFILDAATALDDPSLKTALSAVYAALRYDNHARLDDAAARVAQGWRSFSATSLSSFARCPYQFFARFMLGIEPTIRLRLEPVDIGEFYHKALELMFEQLNRHGLSWSTADKDKRQDLFEDCCQKAQECQLNLKNVLRHSLHMRYLLDSAKRQLRAFIDGLAQLEQAGMLRQALAEHRFRWTLGDVILSGRIDRLDIAAAPEGNIGFVFDYKRSKRKPSFTDLFYGLDIQLLLYLLAGSALPDNIKLAAIGGAFYLPIEKRAASASLSSLEQPPSEPVFAYKAKGIFSQSFANLLVQNPPPKDNPYYDFFVSQNDGCCGCYCRTSVLTPPDFETLLAYGKQLISDLAAQVRAGRIAAEPYKIGRYKACDRCDYKPLCRFDWQINAYRPLTPLDKQQALELCRQKLLPR